jgi:hypothetical protein
MSAQRFRPSQPETVSLPGGASSTHLAGRLLILARVAWGVLACALLGLYAVLLPAYWTQLHTVCADATGSGCAVVQPTPASASALLQVGVSVAQYAAWTFGVALASTLICLAVSAVILWRKSDDWLALLVALGTVSLSTVYVTSVFVQLADSPWRVPATVLNALGNTVVFALFALFPSGRFAPTWMRWVLVAWAVCGMALIALSAWPSAFSLYSLAWVGMAVLLISTQVHRYRQISTLRERQQTKWVVLGAMGAGTLAIGVTVPALVVSDFRQAGAAYQLFIGSGYLVAVVLLATMIGMAVLRSRLFDIDVIIRRTVVYSLLTGTLAVVYFGCVLGAQAVVQAVGGKQPLPPVVIVASTLLIAALFQPLRHRIKREIDRRFYRSRYEARQTLASFGQVVRSEVDLAHLEAQLLGVVEDTLQPTQVSLWLRAPGEPHVGTALDLPPQ